MRNGEVTRSTIEVEVDGVTVSALCAQPADAGGRPLVVALHGGCYNRRYFDIATVDGLSFLDRVAASGYPVASFDRPGYGASSPVAAAENTFERQAELLDGAIGHAARRMSATGVILVGHSIGGMIALTLASREQGFDLLGVSATGMGSTIPPGGAAEGLAAASEASGQEIMSLPADECDGVMFGPPWTFDDETREASHGSYAPAPAVELIAAPKWAAAKLPSLAATVTVPVHNALAEFDALWDSSPESIERFRSLFGSAPSVEATVIRGTGHSIDHHRVGRALHLRQIAFADECAIRRAGEAA